MDDFAIASALCVLSLLNYRNVLKRKTIDSKSRSPNATPVRRPQTPPSPPNHSASLTLNQAKPMRNLNRKKLILKTIVIKTDLGASGNNNDQAEKRRRRRRRCWMKDIHSNRTITSMNKLFAEITFEDSGEFTKFFRMSRSDFDILLSKIEPAITKQTSRMRLPIPAKIRLAIVLRYLATGDSHRSLHNLFKVSASTITMIIPEVCEAINAVLKEELKLPQTPGEWMAIEKQFRRSFPRCVGILDGKRIVCSSHFGADGASSTLLTTIVDSDYNFIFAETGGLKCKLWQKLETDSLNLPPECPLPGRETDVPYVFLGNENFSLSKHVMVPFPGNQLDPIEEHFNYNLLNATALVENVFGVLTSVFNIFKKPIDVERDKVPLITMTCIRLHNFLRRSDTSREIYSPPGTFDSFESGVFVEGTWRQNPEAGAIRSMQQDFSAPQPLALEVRFEFAQYFGTP